MASAGGSVIDAKLGGLLLAAQGGDAVNVEEGALPFWHVLLGFSEGKPVRKASVAELEKTEVHIGYRLPQRLKDLLKIQNGGVSNYEAFVDGERYFPVLDFFGVGEGYGTLIHVFNMSKEYETPDGIVVFAGGAHSVLAFDYRADVNEPQILYQHTEDDEFELVCESFEAFLSGLVEETEL